MKSIYQVIMAATLAASAYAQPAIKAGGIVNSASYTPQSISAGIAQGSIFNVFGTGLGPAALVSSSTFPLPKTLGGTSIAVSAGATTVDAIMIYTSAGQVAAILPSTTPTGAATMTLSYNGVASAPVAFTVVTSSFGAYSINSSGAGAGIFTSGTYQLYGLSYAAQPGETVTMWGTGVGPVAGDEAGGPLPGNLPDVSAQVFVGGLVAPVAYRGRSGCCAGLDQLAFVIPTGITGCHVPVAVQIGTTVSNFVSIPIATGTRTCTDPAISSGIDFSQLSSLPTVSIGEVALFRTTTTTYLPPPLTPTTATIDAGSAEFVKYTQAQFNSSENPFNVTINSFGACTVTTINETLTSLPISFLNFTQLDAGASISVVGPNGTKQLTKLVEGGVNYGYEAQLGGFAGTTTTPLFLSAGSYSVTGPGGADVGAFTLGLTVPTPLTWTNATSVTTVQRSQGQLVTWTGGDPNGSVEIIGSSIVLFATSGSSLGASFACTAPSSAGQFTIPSVVLLSLPASGTLDGLNISDGSLGITSFSNPVSFTATGLDAGLGIAGVSSSQNVTYQ